MAEPAPTYKIKATIEEIESFVHRHPSPPADASLDVWFEYLRNFKSIIGNVNNTLSYASCLLAHDYLVTNWPIAPFDVVSKPQGANGFDIDTVTVAGERLIGEIKTTLPLHVTRFGSHQLTGMRRDLMKLHQADAALRFLFVTEPTAYEALRKQLAAQLNGIELVCLA